jgi:hypothetical protein
MKMAAIKKKAKGELTRAQAEKLVAAATTPSELDNEKLTKHPNRHVVKKVKHKLARLTPT